MCPRRILTFIDADDYVGELYLEHLLEPLHQHPEAQCIHGGHLRYENGKITKVAAPETSHFSPSEAITLSYHPSPIWAVLWKSTFMKQHLDSIHADYHYFIHSTNMSYAQRSVQDLLKVVSAVNKCSNLDYWKNSAFVFSL